MRAARSRAGFTGETGCTVSDDSSGGRPNLRVIPMFRVVFVDCVKGLVSIDFTDFTSAFRLYREERLCQLWQVKGLDHSILLGGRS